MEDWALLFVHLCSVHPFPKGTGRGSGAFQLEMENSISLKFPSLPGETPLPGGSCQATAQCVYTLRADLVTVERKMGQSEIWRFSIVVFGEQWHFLYVARFDPVLPLGLRMPFYSDAKPKQQHPGLLFSRSGIQINKEEWHMAPHSFRSTTVTALPW